MKKTIYISLAATVMAMVLSGCNGMENPPVNQYTDANFWSAERAQYMVNTAYSQMYHFSWLWMEESLTDNVFHGRAANAGGRVLRTGQANSSTDLFGYAWAEFYRGIKTCHLYLDNVDNIADMDAAKKAHMTAEIRFIRASLYFRLITFYGDVPFFKTDITAGDAQTILRTPKGEILDFIRQELQECITDLPKRDDLADSDRGRITKGAAMMLLARTYFYEQKCDWAMVEKLTGNLINQQGEYGTYSLFPSYRGLFEEENEYNQEVILDRAFVPNFITWSDIQDMIPLSRDGRVIDRAPTQSLVDNYLTINGYTIDEPGTDYDPAHPYDKRDPRLTATVIYDGYDWKANVNDWFPTKGKIEIDPRVAPADGIDRYNPSSNGTRTGYFVRKWYAPQAKGQAESGLNAIMMRYADVLLMYAEAKLEQNTLDAAVWNKTVRLVRERAGFTAAKALDFPAGKSQAELRKILRNERRSEFALEGLRWYDILRWKAGSEYLKQAPAGASFTEPLGVTYRFDENKDYLWAIPQSEIDLNENLTQNPGF